MNRLIKKGTREDALSGARHAAINDKFLTHGGGRADDISMTRDELTH